MTRPMHVIFVAVPLPSGCESQHSTPNCTQAQLNAIESREFDANLDQTFAAASGALFDSGYIIAMSDRNAGLITGRKGKDRTLERVWIYPLIRDTEFAVSHPSPRNLPQKMPRPHQDLPQRRARRGQKGHRRPRGPHATTGPDARSLHPHLQVTPADPVYRRGPSSIRTSPAAYLSPSRRWPRNFASSHTSRLCPSAQ